MGKNKKGDEEEKITEKTSTKQKKLYRKKKYCKLRSLHVVICCLRYIIALVRCFAHQLAAVGQTKDSGSELA